MQPIDQQMREAQAFIDGLHAAWERSGDGLPMLREIADAVCTHYGIGLRDMQGPWRARRIAWPRQMFFLLARELSGKSLPQIAMWCGNRDHSTVMYGARMARQRMERDPECLADYRACMEALGYRLSPERGPSDGE